MASDWLKIVRPPHHHDPLVLELDLSRGVTSAPPQNPLQALRNRQAPTMREIRDGLAAGARDDRVAGLVVHTGTCPLTSTQGDELAEAIAEFGEHRPTIAWTETFGELSNGTLGYRIANAAQEIWLQPTGALGLHGVRLEITLLRGAFEKLHLEPEFAQRKEFKSAADTYAAHEVTPANREMMTRIADSILSDTITRVAARRGLDPEAIRMAVDNSPLTATAALEARLVDRIGYRDEVYAELRSRARRERAGDTARQHHTPRRSASRTEDEAEVALQFVHRYQRTAGGGWKRQLEELVERDKPAIGVVGINGGITTGPSQSSPNGPTAGSDTVCAHLREAAREDSVRAVVLRVDSPGGSYVASDQIRREVLQLRAAGKPVIASMGQFAASGGYFVSMGCDQILASPTTLTGSIGVLAGKFVTQGFFDWIGVRREEVLAGSNAGMLSGTQPFTPQQWERLDAWLDEVYADFTTKAAHDRGQPLEELEANARGRVWTGADALTHGLVDRLGGMGAALQQAAERADLELHHTAVRAIPAMPWLQQLRPADSSEHDNRVGVEPGLGDGPEAVLGRLGARMGLPVRWGVLALPWQLQVR